MQKHIIKGHGDVVALSGVDGNVTKRYSYDAFGVEEGPDAADVNPFRYCGEYRDSESGDVYLRARYYMPGMGRFSTEDTYWNVENMVYGDTKTKKSNTNNNLQENSNISNANYSLKQLTEKTNYQQVINKKISDIFIQTGITSNEKIQEINRWRFGQLTEEEKKQVKNEAKGVQTPSLHAIAQSGNLYVYCMNNSVRHTDPSGLATQFSFSINRSGNSTLCFVYLNFTGPDMYSQFAFTSANVNNGTFPSPMVFGNIPGKMVNTGGAFTGSVLIGVVNIPIGATHAYIKIRGLKGYNMSTARWEGVLMGPLTYRIKIN